MKNITNEQKVELLNVLEKRFNKNTNRHPNLTWEQISVKLTDDILTSINHMEETGGEPDITVINNELFYIDFSKESPDRRSLCYDKEALESRKSFKPDNNVIDLAKEMGIELLDENMYKYIQTLGEFDLKTSSWLKTPSDVRKLGGAIFGDRRYNQVFIYHNGADSYYGSRGFRGYIKL